MTAEVVNLSILSGVERLQPDPVALELFRYGEYFAFGGSSFTNVNTTGSIVRVKEPLPEDTGSNLEIVAEVAKAREFGTNLDEISFRLSDRDVIAILELDRMKLYRYSIQRDPYVSMFFGAMDSIIHNKTLGARNLIVPEER